MTKTASERFLTASPANLVAGDFRPLAGGDGDTIQSVNPASPDDVVFESATRRGDVADAVAAARAALPAWSGRSLEERVAVLRRWQALTKANADRIADLIVLEMGKVRGECLFEANALGGKVDITLGPESLSRVTDYTVPVNDSRDGDCRFKPHGVMAVIGPFNFPAHLPNGHWVPALLTGNTIVFKPSDKTPATGQLLAELMQQALDESGAPKGVFNMVQGAADVASTLTADPGIDGILFTGSWPVGRRILEANLDHPGRIVALELGGSNPAVVMPDAHLRQAVIECARAAFATTGQRCTCTRRIIVHEAIADTFIPAFCRTASNLLVGPGDSTDPVFMGPLVTEASAREALEFQSGLVEAGGSVLVQATRSIVPVISSRPAWCRSIDSRLKTTPSASVRSLRSRSSRISMRRSSSPMPRATDWRPVCSVPSVRRSIGTSPRSAPDASIGTPEPPERSSKLPFGGLGHSGNHRPAGAFSVDYCAYPVASMVERGADAAVPAGMQVDVSGK